MLCMSCRSFFTALYLNVKKEEFSFVIPFLISLKRRKRAQLLSITAKGECTRWVIPQFLFQRFIVMQKKKTNLNPSKLFSVCEVWNINRTNFPQLELFIFLTITVCKRGISLISSCVITKKIPPTDNCINF